MQTLWARGSATVPEIVAAVRKDGRDPAYTTVLTVVSRLHQRGLLDRAAERRTHRYRPIVSEAALVEQRSGEAVAAVLARFGSVALRQFAIRLGDLDPETRRALVDLAESGPRSGASLDPSEE